MPNLLVIIFFLAILLVQALSQDCNSDSLTEDEIVSLSLNCTKESCTLTNRRGVNYFFPHMTFSCNGTLVNWTMAGSLVYKEVAANPTLVIWRETSQNPQKYEIHEKTSLIYCNGERMVETSPQVYSCELENGLRVEEGDVVGVEVPFSAASSDSFDLYFVRESDYQPKINFIRGTSIFSFVLSQSLYTYTLPLLSVGVIPDGLGSGPIINDPTFTFTEATDHTNSSSKETVSSINKLQPREIGIEIGAFLLVVTLAILSGIQCYIIAKIRKNRTQKRLSKVYNNRGMSVSSTEPYAMLNLNGMDISTMDYYHDSPENSIQHMPISKKPSYNVIPSIPVPSSQEESMYMSCDDVGITSSPSTTRRNENSENKCPSSLSLCVERDVDSHSAQLLLGSGCSDENVPLAQHHQQPDKEHSNIQEHNKVTSITMEPDDDTSEPIYY